MKITKLKISVRNKMISSADQVTNENIGLKLFTAAIGCCFVSVLFISQGCGKSDKSGETTIQSATHEQTIQTAKVNEQITADAFALKLQDASNMVLDVRTPEEFNSGHLAGAINVDYNAADFKDQVNKLDKSKTYLVYCQRGARSAGAAGVMAGNGFNTIYSLKGGLNEWKGELVK